MKKKLRFEEQKELTTKEQLLQLMESMESSIFVMEDRIDEQGINYLDSKETILEMRVRIELLRKIYKDVKRIYEKAN